MADSEVRQKFQIVKQAELSYEVLLDGEHIEEFSDESSASEYVRWFSAKLDEAYSAGMRAREISQQDKIAEQVLDILHELTPEDADADDPIAVAYQRIGVLLIPERAAPEEKKP